MSFLQSRELPFHSEEDLELALSEPTDAVVETFARLDGDLLVLGASGKMGPSLARMARRAFDLAGSRRIVYGAARFTSGGKEQLSEWGIRPLRCDVFNEGDLAKLPDAAAVIVMLGRKFGSTGDEAATWAANAYVPALVCRRFRDSRLVVFSTGNVYGLVDAERGGSREEDQPRPVGEYAMSTLGRERMYEYFSREWKTLMSIVRLNYACDLRYGVLVDLALAVARGEPIQLGMAYFNTIWQGDANAQSLRTLDHVASPPWVINVTGHERLEVREVCERLGRALGRGPKFVGVESETALLSNSAKATATFGPPGVSAEQLIDWVAHWVLRGGRILEKPTHFESRDGRF